MMRARKTVDRYGSQFLGRCCLVIVVVFLATGNQLLWSADGVVVERDVPVPMSDGTVLRANVFRPSADGPWPVLVVRTPYGKAAEVDGALVRAGFIVVSQDARGRYASDGQFESFLREQTLDASDGFDTVQWASKLPRSTGKVGLFGTSYPGFLAWRAASKRPSALGAMAAFSIPASYLDLEGPGTIRPGRRLKWWFGTISPDLRRRAAGKLPYVNREAVELWESGAGNQLLRSIPWSDLPDDTFGSEAPYVKGWLRQPWRDPWRLEQAAEQVEVPNLNVCGWYDHCNGSIDLHQAIVSKGATATARQHSCLIVGPWSHSGLGKRKQGSVDFGPAADLDFSQLYVAWFRYWLQGKNSEVPTWPAVKLFVMGINEWRDYDQWPPANSTSRAWYFDSEGQSVGILASKREGRLQTEAAHQHKVDQYDYDPRDPVPTLWTPDMFTVPADQRRLGNRTDILVYQSPPISDAVETIGYPEVILHVASDRPDTDFFARLIDVAPDGRAVDIATGMIRVRYRESLEHPKFLNAGEVTELRIRLRPTAHRFLQGHRLRIDITSSDFPNYDRHHNTSADQNSDAELVTARQSLHHGPVYPSRLILPITR